MRPNRALRGSSASSQSLRPAMIARSGSSGKFWMRKTLAIVALMLAPTSALAATVEDVDKSISDLLGDPAAFHDAFIAIQQAVEDDDPDALAEWVQFPINVRMG